MIKIHYFTVLIILDWQQSSCAFFLKILYNIREISTSFHIKSIENECEHLSNHNTHIDIDSGGATGGLEGAEPTQN